MKNLTKGKLSLTSQKKRIRLLRQRATDVPTRTKLGLADAFVGLLYRKEKEHDAKESSS